jgi:hypothetical protein
MWTTGSRARRPHENAKDHDQWAIPRKLWEDCGLDDTGMSQHERYDAESHQRTTPSRVRNATLRLAYRRKAQRPQHEASAKFKEWGGRERVQGNDRPQ